MGTRKTCAPIDECHDPGTCNAMTGQCAPGSAKPDTTPCTGGQCAGGACMPIGSGGAGGSAGSAGSAGSPGSGGDGSGATGGSGAVGDGGSASEAGAGNRGGALGASGSGGSGAREGGLSADDPYRRNPGGCACRSATSPRAGSYWAALAGVSLLLARRSRRRTR
jgi:MYXO-CTERM domain-containing protein